ncbi:hypothetical protein L596_013955 [Steinernema carpocapsae]|uniref:7TM GPCR serpentine receptor class x (Srx) domain-containing protein n=1 Tax=Steinernema carpocapsae TaxID=34508 RepID=A0A4U5NA38_STECR|nr:hypothetical protein L596_013955 [Steinernema carpocapsae]
MFCFIQIEIMNIERFEPTTVAMSFIVIIFVLIGVTFDSVRLTTIIRSSRLCSTSALLIAIQAGSDICLLPQTFLYSYD